MSHSYVVAALARLCLNLSSLHCSCSHNGTFSVHVATLFSNTRGTKKVDTSAAV